MGSDGKDDIRIGIDDKGGRIINEDESLFLSTVEEANGDLEKYSLSQKRKGELTDDFSLLRIEYNDDKPQELEEDNSKLKQALELYNKGRFSSGKGTHFASSSKRFKVLSTAKGKYSLQAWRL